MQACGNRAKRNVITCAARLNKPIAQLAGARRPSPQDFPNLVGEIRSTI
jgi:hypothetical protein